MISTGRAVLLAALFALAIDARSTFGINKSSGHLKRASSDAVCADATMKPFRQCLSAFYASWGYDLNKMPSLKIFGGVVEDYITAHGKDGLRDVVCTRAQAMGNCISNVPNGESCQNAASYHVIFGDIEGCPEEYLEWNAQYSYICGPAENKYLSYFDCMRNTEQEHEADQERCERNYENDMNQGVGTCLAYNNYVTCREAFYTKSCGLQIYGIICNLMEVPFLAEYPECSGNTINCGP